VREIWIPLFERNEKKCGKTNMRHLDKQQLIGTNKTKKRHLEKVLGSLFSIFKTSEICEFLNFIK